MKSLPLFSLSNLKMKGKKSKMLGCMCCTAQNFKWRERLKEARKEIELNKKELNHDRP